MKTTINSKLNQVICLSILLGSFTSKTINAQDMIVKLDSSHTQAVLQEINPTEIKYKLFNYPDGPNITVSKNDVAYITYKNGQSEHFNKPKNCPIVNEFNPNTYNIDRELDPIVPCAPTRKAKNCERLYKHKNYLGINYLAFLNTCLGFNYMHDFKAQHLILNVPIGFGLGKPNISNSMYRGEYLGGNKSNAHYNILKFQGGLSLLYAPSMSREVNFLIGPSFMYSVFNVDVNTKYSIGTTTTSTPYPTTQHIYKTYKNTFDLYRQVYGMSIGFLARFGERINMNALLTLGLKNDTYSKEDPYGHEYIESQGGLANDFDYKYNAMPYANLAISIGYRF